MDNPSFRHQPDRASEIAADHRRTLTTAEENADRRRQTPGDRFLLGIAVLAAMLVFGVASGDRQGAPSLSMSLAGASDPFAAGYSEEYPALPGPYAELPIRHYLAARDR
jgi:hypothetical protein